MWHRGGAQQEKRRYGKAKNHQKLRRFGTPTFKPMVGRGDKKAEADTEKAHRSAQKAQKAQKKKKSYGLRNEGERRTRRQECRARMRHCFEYEGQSRTLFAFDSDDGDIIP